MKAIYIGILLFCVTTASYAVEISRYLRTYDGDTHFFDLRCSIPVFCDNIGIRVWGVDTPEIRGKCTHEKVIARRIRDEAAILISEAKEIKLINLKRGKYFRVVATIVLDGKSLGDILYAKGMAVPYNGGKKDYNWCTHQIPEI